VSENPDKLDSMETMKGVFRTISKVFIFEIFTITGMTTSKLMNLVLLSKSLINSLIFIPYRPKIGVRNEIILG
jgi:hypothetical protein